MGVLKQRGDGGHPARVAGQDAVPAYVLRGTADMKLFFKLLHEIHRSFLFHRLTAALPVFLGKAGLPLWQMMLKNSIADSPADCKAGPGEKAALLDETEIRAFKLANFNRWFEQFNSCFYRKTALFLQFVHEKPLQSDKPCATIRP